MISHNWSPMKRLIWLRGSGITGGAGTYETITGNPVSFTAKAAPLRQLKVAFSPVQAGSGDPSPDNVRPILGWDSLNVEQRGKNLLECDAISASGSSHGIDWVINQDGSITFSGTATENATVQVMSKRNLPSGTFTVSGVPSNAAGTNFRLWARDDLHYFSATNGAKASGTLGENAYAYITIASGAQLTDPVTIYPMLEIGSTATDYQPYNPSSRSISITIGQTVYSGYVDVVTGQGEITWFGFVYDGDTTKFQHPAAWYQQDVSSGRDSFGAYWYFNYDGFNNYPLPKYFVNGSAEAPNFRKCDRFVYSRYGTYNNDLKNAFSIQGQGAQMYIAVRIPAADLADTSSASALATSVEEYAQANPIQFVYELATPIPIQLTPQEVESLAGDNVLFSDANGDLTVEYRSN